MSTRPTLSPELVLVSPDLWEEALEWLPPPPQYSPATPVVTIPVRHARLRRSRLALALAAYVVIVVAGRTVVGVGLVVLLALLLE